LIEKIHLLRLIPYKKFTFQNKVVSLPSKNFLNKQKFFAFFYKTKNINKIKSESKVNY